MPREAARASGRRLAARCRAGPGLRLVPRVEWSARAARNGPGIVRLSLPWPVECVWPSAGALSRGWVAGASSRRPSRESVGESTGLVPVPSMKQVRRVDAVLDPWHRGSGPRTTTVVTTSLLAVAPFTAQVLGRLSRQSLLWPSLTISNRAAFPGQCHSPIPARTAFGDGDLTNGDTFQTGRCTEPPCARRLRMARQGPRSVPTTACSMTGG